MRRLQRRMRRLFGVQDERLIRIAGEKDKILELLRSRGLRVTKQRRLILDIVFEQECICCKEIYYQASKKDKSIGLATVYRMVNVLTDLGVFQVNVPYRLSDDALDKGRNGCRIILKDQSVIELDQEEWQHALEEALVKKGYSRNMKIDRVII